MSTSVQLALVIHNHQPVGNFDHVFEDACERAYMPFLRTLLEFPAIRIGLHTSGCLLEWLEGHRRDYGELVDELLRRGQVELLGGGMYEPILPVLPERDALWQLKRLSAFLQERFGVTPQGAWIPERVWEPQLPEVLAQAGIKYCLLDDYHFEGNAPCNEIATEYFTTSHAGYEVALFPISKQLRYTIPFKPPGDTLQYLRELSERSGNPVAVFGDDGEKFGIWPDTYDWVYERGWLRSFFQALTDNQNWVQLKLPSEILAERQPADAVYIPTRSYYEMGEWTRVDANDELPGHWRNFFNKYPESRQMYDRVVEVSDELHAAEDVPSQAWDDLGRAQCNCSYWHGVFGGLYLNYLRQAVSHHLLRAERSIVGAAHTRPANGVDTFTTGRACAAPTVRLSNDSLSLTFHPAHGLAVSRIDYYPTLFNWADVLARWQEDYHGKLLEVAGHAQAAGAAEGEGHASIHDIVRVKEPGLERMLVRDPHPRHSFVTYFSDAQSAEQFMYTDADRKQVLNTDWPTVAAEVSTNDTSVRAEIQTETGSLVKSFVLEKSGARFELEGQLNAPEKAPTFFVEFNLTALTDQADDRYLELDGSRAALNRGHVLDELNSLALVDGWQGRRLSLKPSPPARLICYPVYTVSSSEAGFERTYQGTCIMLGYDHALLRAGLSIELRIEEL